MNDVCWRGAPVHGGPHAFDLLIELVERSGHLVTKDELLKHRRYHRPIDSPPRFWCDRVRVLCTHPIGSEIRKSRRLDYR
jgi:hypothetical protein